MVRKRTKQARKLQKINQNKIKLHRSLKTELMTGWRAEETQWKKRTQNTTGTKRALKK